ncbi:bifunctional serine/threonine-protein kinase/formylglycine-generating enzyme family protein [Myxococcota bacterium]|nr:bifunctional serine/threonine-protein kinase/formylglycine-generating enzyme family protein [Myxococcota bacterium]
MTDVHDPQICYGCREPVPEGEASCPACGARPASGTRFPRDRWGGREVELDDRRVRLGRPMGIGAFGAVYPVEGGPEEWVGTVLKVLHSFAERPPAAQAMARRRFEQEARILMRLGSHPNLIRCHGHGILHDGTPWIAMDRAVGLNLAVYLRERGAPPAPLALELARQLAAAMAFVGDAEVVGRDYKPDNVVVRGLDGGEPPHLTVLDFGAARYLYGPGLGTVDGGMVGTLPYAPPEQMTDATSADLRSDVFAYGTIVYELLTGRRLFGQRGFGACLAAKTEAARPEISIPGEPAAGRMATGLITACTAPRPDDRPPDLHRVGEAVAGVIALLRAPARAAGRASPRAATSAWPTGSPRVARLGPNATLVPAPAQEVPAPAPAAPFLPTAADAAAEVPEPTAVPADAWSGPAGGPQPSDGDGPDRTGGALAPGAEGWGGTEVAGPPVPKPVGAEAAGAAEAGLEPAPGLAADPDATVISDGRPEARATVGAGPGTGHGAPAFLGTAIPAGGWATPEAAPREPPGPAPAAAVGAQEDGPRGGPRLPGGDPARKPAPGLLAGEPEPLDRAVMVGLALVTFACLMITAGVQVIRAYGPDVAGEIRRDLGEVRRAWVAAVEAAREAAEPRIAPAAPPAPHSPNDRHGGPGRFQGEAEWWVTAANGPREPSAEGPGVATGSEPSPHRERTAVKSGVPARATPSPRGREVKDAPRPRFPRLDPPPAQDSGWTAWEAALRGADAAGSDPSHPGGAPEEPRAGGAVLAPPAGPRRVATSSIAGARVWFGPATAESLARCRSLLGPAACEDRSGPPLGWIQIDAFRLDRVEVSRERYLDCVAAGRCGEPRGGLGSGRGDLPVTGVSPEQAATFCRSVGGRLPTWVEWEAAASWGPGFDAPADRRFLPFVGAPDCDRARLLGCGSGPGPVSARPRSASAWGVRDLLGNVAEWVIGPTHYELRGGSWLTPAASLTALRPRHPARSGEVPADAGFRCAMPAAGAAGGEVVTAR